MTNLVAVFDSRPCGEELHLGNETEPWCDSKTGCAKSFHLFGEVNSQDDETGHDEFSVADSQDDEVGEITIAYMRRPCDECESCHIDDSFAAPCLMLARDCRMLCFVGTGAISVPPPLMDFAADVGIPLRVIADIGADPNSRLARWMPDIPIYYINFRLAKLRRMVASGKTVTVSCDILDELTQYWNVIAWDDVSSGNVRINLADVCLVKDKLPQDDADKFIADVNAIGRKRLDEDKYLRRKDELWHGETVCFDRDLVGQEINLIDAAVGADRLSPAEFIELMSSSYTFGWKLNVKNEHGRFHPWSPNLLAKMDEINAKKGISKYTNQYLVFPSDDHMRNNPIIDALLKSRRYGLMVFACIMSIGELLARDDIREYVADTFREWGRDDLVANFEYLLANECRLMNGILIHHRKQKDAGEYLARGCSMGHFMFADVKSLAAAEVGDAMTAIGLAVPPRK